MNTVIAHYKLTYLHEHCNVYCSIKFDERYIGNRCSFNN